MATLAVSVQPTDLNLPKNKYAKARSRVVIHYQEIVVKDENGDITSREASLPFDISPGFTGQIEILDYVPETPINLSLTSTTGMLILSENVVENKLRDGEYTWRLNQKEIERVKEQIDRKPLYPSILNRQGQFVSIGFPSPEFSKYKLMISPIRAQRLHQGPYPSYSILKVLALYQKG